MKKYSLIAIFLLLSMLGFSQPPLSKNAEISLLTCAPGTEIYSLFGHSAIRITDTVHQLDFVFNYGIFSYNVDNFAYKFAKGNTMYQLGVQRYSGFIKEYVHENRPIYEHVLNLNTVEKQEVFEYLHNNSLPENRVYLYKFFLDNCATRPRDVIETVLGNKLQWQPVDDKYVAPPKDHWKADTLQWCWDKWDKLSYRNILYIYLENSQWAHYGINLGLGQPTDTLVGKYAAMFAPDFLMHSFENARIVRDGIQVSLVKDRHLVVEKQQIETKDSFSLSPTVSFLLLFIITLCISYIELRKNKKYPIFDIALFLLTGLTGLLLVFLSMFSVHDFVAHNYDIVWANPFNVIFALLLISKKLRNYTSLYFYFIFVSLSLLVITWPIIPENLNESSLFIIASMLIRSIMGIRTLWNVKTA